MKFFVKYSSAFVAAALALTVAKAQAGVVSPSQNEYSNTAVQKNGRQGSDFVTYSLAYPDIRCNPHWKGCNPTVKIEKPAVFQQVSLTQNIATPIVIKPQPKYRNLVKPTVIVDPKISLANSDRKLIHLMWREYNERQAHKPRSLGLESQILYQYKNTKQWMAYVVKQDPAAVQPYISQMIKVKNYIRLLDKPNVY